MTNERYREISGPTAKRKSSAKGVAIVVPSLQHTHKWPVASRAIDRWAKNQKNHSLFIIVSIFNLSLSPKLGKYSSRHWGVGISRLFERIQSYAVTRDLSLLPHSITIVLSRQEEGTRIFCISYPMHSKIVIVTFPQSLLFHSESTSRIRPSDFRVQNASRYFLLETQYFF